MSSGGLAHVIFNLPTRITLCEHIALYRRVAKLKMLCRMPVLPHYNLVLKIGSCERPGLHFKVDLCINVCRAQ